MVVIAACCAALASGCALAMPTATFGSTTPRARADLAGGVAVRVARGDLRPGTNTVVDGVNQRAAVDATGLVPVVAARYGLRRGRDLGVVVSGTGGRFDLRAERVIREGSTRVALVLGVGPSYSYIAGSPSGSGSAHLVAVEPTLALGVDFGSLYEAWVGPRISLGGLTGSFDDAMGSRVSARAARLDVGGVFGIAAGLRRVHGFVELSAMYERWWASNGGVRIDRAGLVLIPAFGLRVRL